MGQGSTDLRLNDILLRIISFTKEHDISLLPTWVPRDQNKIADGLTHLEDPCDWTLNADVFQIIVAQWGLPTIEDCFASHSIIYLTGSTLCCGAQVQSLSMRLLKETGQDISTGASHLSS